MDWFDKLIDSAGETAGEMLGTIGNTASGMLDSAGNWAMSNVDNWLDGSDNKVVSGTTQDVANSSDTAQAIHTPPQANSGLTIHPYALIGGAIALLILLILLLRGK